MAVDITLYICNTRRLTLWVQQKPAVGGGLLAISMKYASRAIEEAVSIR